MTADERVWLVSGLCAHGRLGVAGSTSWAACASGRAAGSAGLAHKAEQAWAAAAPSSFLSLLFVANLVRV